MKSFARSIMIVGTLAMSVLSCESPTGVPDAGSQLVWITAPPASLREGAPATATVELRDGDGRPLLTLDGTPVTLRLAFAQDSQPGTSCGAACTTTVAQGRAQMTVDWVSAGSWTAIACVRPAVAADSVCVQSPLTVLPIHAALVTFPTDSVARRARFAVEARLRLPDGTAVTDLARPVRLRFASSAAPGPRVECPEAGPLCERTPVAGIVRLDSVVMLDTAATTLQACVLAPNGHERCDPAGPRAFRVVLPLLTLRFATQPSGGFVGVPFATQPVIEALEPDGTRRTDFTGVVSVMLESDAALGPALAGTGHDGALARRIVTARAAAGLATFTALRLNRVGLGHRLVASSPGATPITSGLFGATVDATVLDVVKNGGDQQYALTGTAVPVAPSVVVSGPLADRIIGVPIVFTSGGWGQLTDSSAVSDTTGTARLGAWTLATPPGTYTGPAGANTVYARLENEVRQTFVSEAVVTSRLAFVVEPADTLIAGDTIGPAVVVELQDAQGRRVFGATDAVEIAAIGCSTQSGCSEIEAGRFLGTRTRNAVNGRASFDDLSITVGYSLASYILQARHVDALVDGKTLRILPDLRSAQLQFTGGTSLSGTVGTAIGTTPIVNLKDRYGNLFVAHPIAFSVTMGGGSVTGAPTETDYMGEARVASWILGPAVGVNALSVRAAGVADTAVAFADGNAPAFFVRDISAGWDFTCAAAAATGYPYCWGANAYSQLGDGTQTARARPTQLSGQLLELTRVTGGTNFACGLASSGAAYCWGNNWYGQLGIDTTDVSVHATPEPVARGHVFTQISAGFRHACALDTEGAAWCWGAPSEGSLGAEITESPDYPLPVATTLKFTKLDVGGNTSCAIAESGELWCWGSNSYGGVGNNSTDERVYAPALVAGGRTYTEVSVGTFHTCAISAGTVYCWGRNVEAQLGVGYASPTVTPGSAVPLPVLGALGTSRQVSAGNMHTCAVNGAGEAYCWGRNSNGEVGDLSTTQRTSGVLVVTAARFVSISTGLLHTCGLTEAGAAYCWGSNGSGRLGTGNAATFNATAPLQVTMP